MPWQWADEQKLRQQPLVWEFDKEEAGFSGSKWEHLEDAQMGIELRFQLDGDWLRELHRFPLTQQQLVDGKNFWRIGRKFCRPLLIETFRRLNTPRCQGTLGVALASIGRELAVERAMGFEPTTFCLGSKHSTTELRPRLAFDVIAEGVLLSTPRIALKETVTPRAYLASNKDVTGGSWTSRLIYRQICAETSESFPANDPTLYCYRV